jgi:hypothetical protein
VEHDLALRAAAVLLAGLSATSPLRSAAAADSGNPPVDQIQDFRLISASNSSIRRFMCATSARYGPRAAAAVSFRDRPDVWRHELTKCNYFRLHGRLYRRAAVRGE